MSNEITIDPKKLNKMKIKILKAEQDNLKTHEKKSEEMVDLIRRIIVTEAKKRVLRRKKHAYQITKDAELPPVQGKYLR